jgi:hypothetical protein
MELGSPIRELYEEGGEKVRESGRHRGTKRTGKR